MLNTLLLFNKSDGSIFDKKLKQGNLAINSNIDSVSHRANNNKEKIEKPQTFDLCYFLGKNFFVDVFKKCFFSNQYLARQVLNKKNDEY